MGQVTIMSGVERRRTWTDEQKRALVAAISQPGANVADIARQADLRPGQIYRWRRQMLGETTGFAQLVAEPERSAPSACAVVVELDRAVVRISANASPTLAAAVLRSLRQ